MNRNEGYNNTGLLFNSTTDFGAFDYEIFNTLGQKITTNMDNSSNGYKATVNLASVASGMYLVKLYNNEFSTVKRLVVQ